MTDKIKRRKASASEIIRIGKLLSEVMIKTEASEDARARCEYQSGWDDLRIAKEIGGYVSASVVSNIRRQLYGNFIAKSGRALSGASSGALKARVTRLEAEVHEISLSNAHLLLRVNEIERTLGMAPTTVKGNAKPQPDMSEPKKEVKNVAHA